MNHECDWLSHALWAMGGFYLAVISLTIIAACLWSLHRMTDK